MGDGAEYSACLWALRAKARTVGVAEGSIMAALTIAQMAKTGISTGTGTGTRFMARQCIMAGTNN